MAATGLDDVSGVLVAIGPVTGMRVVDAGGGTGRLAAALVALGASVTLVEPEAAMLDQARRACPVAVAVQADFAHSGLAEADYDVVVFRDSLHHMADAPAALAEARRLLAPGGRVVVAEFDASRLASRMLAVFERLLVERVTYWTPEELQHTLETNFSAIDVPWRRRHEFVVTGRRD
jgi:demethylmenaquinone methyltransferase/2-methoxy-6-polyprenyl-1,4-benzoquinol methylase